MHNAGWAEVWHLVLAIIARQPPFAQILLATGAVFVVVMAIEGVRASLIAIRQANAPSFSAEPSEKPVTLAMPGSVSLSKGFSVKPAARTAAPSARRPKPSALPPRQFRSPRPTIRRQPPLESAGVSEIPAGAALEMSEAH